MNLTTKIKAMEHPMEEVLDLPSGSTLVEYTAVEPTPLTQHPTYDLKDTEIENQLETIYTTAMGTASTINDTMEQVEGKYKARVGEVTATMLNVALAAVREKAQLKMHKDKLATTTKAAGTPGTVNNNLVVADRNEIIKMLSDMRKS